MKDSDLSRSRAFANKLTCFYRCYALIIIVFLLTHNLQAQIYGCTDPLSQNYNPAATINDGSCTYNTNSTVSTGASFQLPTILKETSGLIYFDGSMWSHNDDTDTNLYRLSDGFDNYSTIQLKNVRNVDWEEISQDENYIYIGDFGNNASGNRKDLNILRVSKQSVLQGNAIVDTIFFSYNNQTNFTATAANKTDFDCEAFVVSADSIYLFTKQWLSQQTSVYVMPKNIGTHVAQFKHSLPVNGLITGATMLPDKKITVLCGYSTSLQPFLYLLYDYRGHEFATGNKRKITIVLAYHQVEAIAAINPLTYYITNEYFVHPLKTTTQKIHLLDLKQYLHDFVDKQTAISDLSGTPCRVYYSHNSKVLNINCTIENTQLQVSMYDANGRLLQQKTNTTSISMLGYPKGVYAVVVTGLQHPFCERIVVR